MQMQLRWRTGMHHAMQGPAPGQTQKPPTRRAAAGCRELLTSTSLRPLLRPSWTTFSGRRIPGMRARSICKAASGRSRESSTHRMRGKATLQPPLGCEASGEHRAPVAPVPCHCQKGCFSESGSGKVQALCDLRLHRPVGNASGPKLSDDTMQRCEMTQGYCGVGQRTPGKPCVSTD